MPAREGTYGMLAEFDNPSDLVRATKKARSDGWRRMECYTPYPVEEAAEALNFHRNKVPLVTLIGGLMGLAAMFYAPNFRDGALTDKFFLCLEAHDPKFDPDTTRAYLEGMQPLSVVEVEY
jgi:hypothetical protein